MTTLLLVLAVLIFVTVLVVLVITYDNCKQLEIQQEQLDSIVEYLHQIQNANMRAFETNLEVNKLVSSSLKDIANALSEINKKQVRSYKKKENSQN